MKMKRSLLIALVAIVTVIVIWLVLGRPRRWRQHPNPGDLNPPNGSGADCYPTDECTANQHTATDCEPNPEHPVEMDDLNQQNNE